jgi:hypothetical protein
MKEIKAIITSASDRGAGIESHQFEVDGLTDLLDDDETRQDIRKILHDAFTDITTMPVSVMFSDELDAMNMRIIVEQDYFDCAGGRWIARLTSNDEVPHGYGDTAHAAVQDLLKHFKNHELVEQEDLSIFIPVRGHGTG